MDTSVRKNTVGRFLQGQYLVALISCVVIALSVVFAKRRPFFFPIETQLYFASVITVLWGLFVVGWIIAKRRIFDLPQMLREAWPLLVYYALSMLLLGVALIREQFSSAILHMTFNYWVLYPAVPLAWFMGKAGSSQLRKLMPIFILCLTTFGFILCLGQLFQDLGHTNIIGDLLVWFHNVNLPLDSWIWTPGEALRLTGYSFDPNYFAVFVLTGIVWALCGHDRIVIRALVFVESCFMLYYSASRGVLLAFLLVVLACLIGYRHRLVTKVKEDLSTIQGRVLITGLVSVVIVAVLGLGFLAVKSDMSSMVSRVGTSVVAIRQHGLTADTLDTLSNGRGELWVSALRLIKARPLGYWRVERQLSAKSFHNDYLVAWLCGGPVLFLSFIVMLIWMGRLRVPSAQRVLPFALMIVCVVTGFFYNIFQFGAVLPLVFFILGAYSITGKRVSAHG